MDAKSLKRLNRRELLELMVQISEENETLTQENEVLKSELENRKLSAREVGSLAHAALEANNYFLAAENAAKLYLENIVRMEQETQARSSKLLEETLTECITMRAAAGFAPEDLVPASWGAAPAAPSQEVPGAPEASNQEAQAQVSDEAAPVAPSQEAPAAPEASKQKPKKKGLFGRKKK